MHKIKLVIWGILHLRWPKFVASINLKIRARHANTLNQKILRRMSQKPPKLFTNVAGRLTLREYVAERLGENYLPLLLTNCYQGSELNLEDLPREFVLKTNHGSGSFLISYSVPEGWSLPKNIYSFGWKRFYLNPKVLKKNEIKIQEISKKWLTMDYSYSPVRFPEPWYEDIPKGLIVEELLKEDGALIPSDIKFFVFHGEVRMIRVDTSIAFGKKTMAHFDVDWNLLDTSFSERKNLAPYPLTQPLPQKPVNLKEMLRVSSILGEDFDFVRVDLFNTTKGIRIGELTLAPTSGQGVFTNPNLDHNLGKFW